MVYLFVLIMAVLFIEFLFLMVSYDDYFDNIGWSIFWGIIVTIIIVVAFEGKVCPEGGCPDDQETQLEEQWSTEGLEDEINEIFGIPSEESTGPLVRSELPTEPVITVNIDKPLIVPTRSAHIDSGRRNNQVKVTYDDESKQACIGKSRNNNCFKVKLVQHTDGTFWACRRNYGACYNYTMAD